MAFYYDHQSEIEAQLERDRRDDERLRAAAGESAAVQRLRTEGKLHYLPLR